MMVTTPVVGSVEVDSTSPSVAAISSAADAPSADSAVVSPVDALPVLSVVPAALPPASDAVPVPTSDGLDLPVTWVYVLLPTADSAS